MLSKISILFGAIAFVSVLIFWPSKNIVNYDRDMTPDTLYIKSIYLSGTDSLNKNNLIVNEKPDFWLEFLSIFIGTFSAALVAFFTVWLTNRYKEKQESRLNTKKYFALLKSLKSDLIYQKQILGFLLEELEITNVNMIKLKKNIFEKPFRTIRVKFIEDVRNRMLSIHSIDEELLISLTVFLNQCELINSDLNYNTLVTSINNIGYSVNFDQIVDGYFKKMIKHVEEIRGLIPNIVAIIDKNLDA